MTVNRRKKDTRQRGSHTHGWGSKKKHRGAGNRGGKGMAGTGKRADQKKPSIWDTEYFGKHGFVHHGKHKVKAVNVLYLDQHIDKLLLQKVAKEESGIFVVNLADIGVQKLLGTGRLNRKMRITAQFASAGALESVKSAGGQVLLPGEK